MESLKTKKSATFSEKLLKVNMVMKKSISKLETIAILLVNAEVLYKAYIT